MIMNYIPSEKVTVFPSSLRSAQNGDRASGKYTSEENLTGMIRTLANKDSFIISWPDNISESNPAEFVINGYYFKITDTPQLTNTLFAGIKLDNAKRLSSLDGNETQLDPGSNFIGLGFQDSNSGFDYYLQILDGGNVVTKNFHKFNADTIFLNEGEGSSLEEMFSGNILSVEHGGTGVGSLTAGNALIGNGTSPLGFREILNKSGADTVTTSNKLVTENTLYYSTATINGSGQSRGINLCVPVTKGSSGTIPVAQGGDSAPIWTAPGIVGNSTLNGLSVESGNNVTGSYLISNKTNGGTTFYKMPAENIRVGGLLTSRNLQVSLSKTSATSFDGTANVLDIGVSGTLAVGNGGTGQTSFTSGNLLMGNGSGALSTIAKASTNTASTVVVRDGSGNFSAGTITASLTGTASNNVLRAGDTMTGVLKAQNNTSYTTGQMRNVFLIADGGTAPTGGNGDIWITYVN